MEAIELKMKMQKEEEQKEREIKIKPEIIKEIKLINAVYQSILVTK